MLRRNLQRLKDLIWYKRVEIRDENGDIEIIKSDESSESSQESGSDQIDSEIVGVNLPVPERPGSEHFQPDPTKKSMPENKSKLDPNRKNRNSSDVSSNSLSGDEFEQTLKRFHGQKRLKRIGANPKLPDARQVEAQKRKFWDCFSDSEIPIKRIRMFENNCEETEVESSEDSSSSSSE